MVVQKKSSVNEFISRMKDRVAGPVESRETLSEWDMWSHQGPILWRAGRFTGSPTFYPVYQFSDFYSYSVLALILLKGSLRLNRPYARKAPEPGCPYIPGSETIDLDIRRVGDVPISDFSIKVSDEFAHRMADAMRQDIHAVEQSNTGYTNVILCGGKDSLNLLLLPWKNPVLVASAPPNFDLVRRFIRDNGLKFDMVQLNDDDKSLMETEILINCRRNNLEHFKWGAKLKEISDRFNRNSIFWKGQLGAVFLTPLWKRYTHPPHTEPALVSKLFNLVGNHGKHRFYSLLQKGRVAQRMCFNNLWVRGAAWQGGHVAFLRELTGSLVLSGYHGPAVREVLSRVDLYRAVQSDVRPLIGRHLHGRSVAYPSENPGPPRSTIRRGISHLDLFLKLLPSTGVPIYTEPGSLTSD